MLDEACHPALLRREFIYYLHLSLLQFCKKIQNSYFPPNLFLQLITANKIKLEMYSNFRSTIFPEIPSSECFSLCAIVTRKKRQVIS